MLPSKLTATVLYMAPNLPHLYNVYSKKLKALFSYQRNIMGEPADMIFSEIAPVFQYVMNLKLLINALNVTFSLIPDKFMDVLKYSFFRAKTNEEVGKILGYTKNKVSYERSVIMHKASVYLEVLGFDEKTLIEAFDDQELFIRTAKIVEKKINRRNNCVKYKGDFK